MIPEPPCYPPLRLNVCPRCEYSLAAHAPEGVCPECGRPYDAGEIILYGYGRTQWSAKPSSTLAIVASAGVLVTVVLTVASAAGTVHAVVWSLSIGVGLAADLWRRHAGAAGAPLVQVKLTPSGFRQGERQVGPVPFERSDTAEPHRWDANVRVRFNFVEAGRVQIIITGVPERWWRRRREYVDADVAIEPGQLQAISARISRWLGDAERARVSGNAGA